MKNVWLALSCAASLGGCAITTPIAALNDEKLTTVGLGDDEDFKALVSLIGKDSSTLLSRSNEWNRAEGLAGLALLASAAYGGFNSVYDGDNVKDAGFAAASIASLNSYISPGGRREATAKAGRRLNCLYEKASVFAEAAPTLSIALTPNNGSAKSISFNDFTTSKSQLLESVNVANPLTENRISAAVEKARREFLADRAVSGLMRAQVTNDEIRKERFVITASTYRKIINDLFSATKFNAGSYESSLNAYKDAVREETEQKAEVETSVKSLIALYGKDDPAYKTGEDLATKVTTVKTELVACALID